MKRLFTNTVAAGDPERARLLVHQLWSALELLENRDVSQRELSGYLGLSGASLSDWLQGNTALHQIEAALRLLERLPDRWRRGILQGFLREHPHLHGPQLAHEPATPGRLRALLKKPKGITFVLGATVSERTWVVTALGHAQAAGGAVVGWAAQSADWFVPVPGVRYGLAEEWLEAERSPDADHFPVRTALALQLSQGLWVRFPEHRRRLLSAAQTRPVLVADALMLEPLTALQQFPELAGTIDVLELSVPRPGRIHIEFRAA